MLFDDNAAALVVQTVCGPVCDGVVPVSINSLAESAADTRAWVRHVTANLRVGGNHHPAGSRLQQLRERCTEAVAPEELYAGLLRRGIDFGGDFHVIRQLWRGEAEAIGEIALRPEFAVEASAYRVHPVLLDGCLQVIAAALPAEKGCETLYLPIGIGKFTLYGQLGVRCISHVTVAAGTGESRRADVRVFDDAGAVVAELSNVQLKRVASRALDRLGERWLEQSLYEIRWQTSPNANETPSGGTLAAFSEPASKAIEGLRHMAGIDAYDAFRPRLESLCADYTMCAMQRLGWAPAPGEIVVERDLAKRLRVAPRHGRLFGRLLGILAEAGWLAPEQQGWRVERPFTNRQPERQLAHLAEECPAGAEAELEMVGRVAGELAEALRGERDPVQLLFPGGSITLAEKLYRDSPTAKFFNGLMTEVMEAVAAAHDNGRPLRILEIGAGTGGTTAHVLPRILKRNVEYTFTDVGPTFVSQARERFGMQSCVQFDVLDLDRDPDAQGFKDRQFDVVIASNVIHATKDLRRTLAHVRRLLVPGGLLAMLEVTAPQRWFDLTVGLTPGWWAFTDEELRPGYATLKREQWLKLLPECGFRTG